MAKKRWFDIFGWIYRRDVENERLSRELDAARKALEEYSGPSMKEQLLALQALQAELKAMKAANETKQKRLDEVLKIQQKVEDMAAKRSVGRPRIDSVAMNFHLDLDTSLVVETILAASGQKRTRYLNDIIRAWHIERYPEIYEEIKSGKIEIQENE